MVVITALISAPGLARNILVALSKVDVGTAFDAGIAIVILAIVLDRLTIRRRRVAGRRGPALRRRRGGRRWRRLGGPRVLLVIGLAAPARHRRDRVPGYGPVLVRRPGERRLVDWFTGTFRPPRSGYKNVATNVVLNPLEGLLTSAPWWLVIAIDRAHRVGRLRAAGPALVAAVCLALIILLNLWSHSMATLANVLVATRPDARHRDHDGDPHRAQ